jgi:uncharacterized membrane protein
VIPQLVLQRKKTKANELTGRGFRGRLGRGANGPRGYGMEEKGSSSTGMPENVAAFFSYLLGFITGIIFLVVEKKSSFVRFHAMQSTITFLGLFVLSLILSMIPIINALVLLLVILALILWLILMVKALRGERYALPIVGKLCVEKTGER